MTLSPTAIHCESIRFLRGCGILGLVTVQDCLQARTATLSFIPSKYRQEVYQLLYNSVQSNSYLDLLKCTGISYNKRCSHCILKARLTSEPKPLNRAQLHHIIRTILAGETISFLNRNSKWRGHFIHRRTVKLK